jgi:alpha-L-rhamnosidase
MVHKAPGSSSQNLGDLVDWPASSRDGYVFTTVNTVINAFQYAAFDACAKIAGVLGRTSEAESWRAKAETLAVALRSTLLDSGNGRFYDGAGTTHSAQHATAFPVALGVAGPGTVGDDVLAKLGETLAAGGMKVSVYGAQFLLDALFACGRADAAIALMTGTGTNSWLHLMDDLGATIVGEAWDPSLKSNMTFSHAWGSAPANVISRHVLGVQVSAPGAAELTIRPRLGTLTSVRGRVPTIRGVVEVEVERGERAYRLTAQLPPNTSTTMLVEIGADDPKAYHVSASPAPGARDVTTTVDTDVTGRVLRITPVGSGTVTVHRDSRS